jgi:LysR family transcriptional activator of nhaA
MINYKHLHYFWVVAKQGGIARAAERLHLTPQTISGQISLLEDSIGEALFTKAGRNLELTDTGRLTLNYADEIFSLGDELEDALRNLPQGRRIIFKVGIADVVPKTIAYRLLAPALSMADPVRITCRESNLNNLLAELALHRVDLVIADGPIPAGINVRGFSHALGECGISFLAVPELAGPLRKEFPRSLNGAPLLIPSETNLVQAKLLDWLDRLRIHPRIVGEFDDSALMKVFGQAGTGVFIVPSPIAGEVAKHYGVRILGSTEEVREQYYAISVERRISHPAVSAVTETAREWLNPAT